MSNPVIERLDALIIATQEAGMRDRYLNTEGVALLLSFSTTYTRDNIVHAPDFPTPLRIGRARWLRSDVPSNP